MANILVVDDDADLRPLMKLTLMKLGHTPTLAARGEEGLTAALTGQFDALILDIMMPDVDGYEVARRLRADPRTHTLPILVLTARAQLADYETALEAGANDYLAKPFNAEELNAKLNAILQLNQPRAATGPASTLTGQVTTVLSLRGGVGTTTMAVTLAGALTRSGKKTCLVDLSPSGGHATLQLRLRPQTTWLDLPLTVSPNTISQSLLQHESGLQVLAAPPMPVRRPLGSEQFQMTLNALRGAYAQIIIDAAPTLDDATSLALTTSRTVILVCTPEVGAVQTAIGTLRVLANLGVAEGKLKVLLNQVTPEAGLPQAAVEKALGRAMDAVVPFDRMQASALAHGTPLVFGQPASPLVSAVGPWALKL